MEANWVKSVIFIVDSNNLFIGDDEGGHVECL